MAIPPDFSQKAAARTNIVAATAKLAKSNFFGAVPDKSFMTDSLPSCINFTPLKVEMKEAGAMLLGRLWLSQPLSQLLKLGGFRAGQAGPNANETGL